MGKEITEAQYLRAKIAILEKNIYVLKSQIEVWERERINTVAAYYCIDELIVGVKNQQLTHEEFYSRVLDAMQEIAK
jgi:hypothetical protein